MGILNSETDRLRKRAADLEDALEKFVAAMDMRLVGSKREEALCAAEDNARDLLALNWSTIGKGNGD